jgi:hypothetical protein
MYPQEKVSEKCPCIHGTDVQDWNMTPRNAYPLLREQVGLVPRDFDAPNLRLRYFGGPMQTKVFPTALPGRPYAPSGPASLDPYLKPVAPDVPKYGADTTGGGSPWPLLSFLSPASPDPRGSSSAGDDGIPATFGLAALIMAMTPLLIAGGIIYLVYIYIQ